MKFKYTILYVDDVPATLAFFEDAFGLTRAMLVDTEDYGVLDSGDTQLAFASIELMQSNTIPIRKNAPAEGWCSEIGFETEDVPAALARARKAGATLVSDVQEKPWGQTVAFVTDPNGFLIEICSPIQS